MNKIKILTASLAASIMVFAANAQTPNDVIEKFNEAAEQVNNKNYAQAINTLNQVIELGLEVGDEALEQVNQAQKLLPACYFRVGLAYAQANDMEEALPALETAAELGELYGDVTTMRNANTMISRVYTAMGINAFNSEDYATAAEIFAKGYEANPTDTDLALNLAMSYAEMGDERGFQTYREIIALEERHSKYKEPADTAREKLAYYMMLNASEAIQEKDIDKAYEILGEILEADPQSALASMMLIQTATNQKNWDKVIEWGEVAATAQTDDELRSNAYFLLGAAYQNKENKSKAIENYRKVTTGPNVATAKAQISALNN